MKTPILPIIRPSALLFAAILALSALTTQVQAQTNYTWTNIAGGSFGAAANWSPSGIPTTNDSIVGFSGSTNVAVRTTNSTTHIVSSVTVTNDFTGFGTENMWMIQGNTTNRLMTITGDLARSNGGQNFSFGVNMNIRIGGQVLVEGAATNSSTLQLGRNGSAIESLRVTNQATVFSNGILQHNINTAGGTRFAAYLGGAEVQDGGIFTTHQQNGAASLGDLSVAFLRGDGRVVANNAAGTAAYSYTGNLIINGNSAASNSFSGRIGNAVTTSSTNQAALAVIKTGSNIQTLSGSNAYTGGTTLSGGALLAGHDSAFGTGPLTLAGGTLASDSAAARALINSVVVTNGSPVILGQASGGTGDIALSNVSLTASAGQLRISNDSVTIAGEVSGAGRLSVGGTGNLTLASSNSYAGGTQVGGGTLRVGDNNALSSGAVTVSGGGSVLANTGLTITNNFSFPAGTVTNFIYEGVLASWEFGTLPGGTANYGPSPFAPLGASGVSMGGLTRGSGVGAAGTGAANAWGGQTWPAADQDAAIAANQFATFTVTVGENSVLSLTNIGAYNVRRSGTGPTNGIWQYSTNGVDFVNIGTAITWGADTTAAGNPQSAIDLDSIPALQTLPAGTTVTMRVVNWNGASGGTWYLNDPAGTPGSDFTVSGQILGVSSSTGTETIGLAEAGAATFSGPVDIGNAAFFSVPSGGQATFSGAISGSSATQLIKIGAGTIVLSGTNSYVGQTVISNGLLELAPTGILPFFIGASGSNNAVSGPGSALFRGTFAFDLSGASTNHGSSWTIASVASQTFDGSFQVAGFTNSGGTWTIGTNGVFYQFSQSSGVLTASTNLPSGGYAGWVSYWQGIDPGFTNTAGTADPDGDLFDNDTEFAFDGNPMVGNPALLTAVKSGANAVFTWVQRNSGVTYTALTTTNLATGSWTNAAVTVTNAADQSGINIPADYTRKSFTVPATNNRFYSIEAVAP